MGKPGDDPVDERSSDFDWPGGASAPVSDGKALPRELSPGIVVTKWLNEGTEPRCYLGTVRDVAARIFLWGFPGAGPIVPESVRTLQLAGAPKLLAAGRLSTSWPERSPSFVAYREPSGTVPLHEWRTRPRRPADLLELATRLASLIAGAHAAGVLHGFLDPGLVSVDRSGVPFVFNLGLHAHQTAVSRAHEDVRNGLLDEHFSVHYTPPEVLAPKGPGASVAMAPKDVYSLGGILFWLLSGHAPFEDKKLQLVIRAIVLAPRPKLRSLAPHWPEHIEAILVRALALVPAERPSAAELVRALEQPTGEPAIEQGDPLLGAAAPQLFLESLLELGSHGPTYLGTHRGRRARVYIVASELLPRIAALTAARTPPPHGCFPALLATGPISIPLPHPKHFLAYDEPDPLETVEAWRDAGREPAELVRLAQIVAEALHAAHVAGVLHGQLDPRKLFVTPRGEPRILELGLREALRTPGLMDGWNLRFSAPEALAQGGLASAVASEVYALGATVFWLFARRAPHHEGTLLELLRAINEDAPPRLRSLAPHAPEAVEAAVARALEKKPGDRFATAADFARALIR